jgi:hypothetical protein
MPRATRPKPARPTVWRETSALLVGERQRFHARRGGLNLEVSLRSAGFVLAVVSHVMQPEGRHETLSDYRWPLTMSDTPVVESTIAVAKQWCETQANNIVGFVDKAATEFARTVKRGAK